ncbi:hypothetical protein HRbin16_00454 [bacterium HR16]|nr:hypothetical protein HRbin16_00454 [bacterium HR16]
MVRCPCSWRRLRASSMARRTSATPLVTALYSTKWHFVCAAIIRARVDLPQPGGPQKITEPSWSFSMALRIAVPSPTRCSCPTNSSSVRGRIRAASGASVSVSYRFFCSNRLMVVPVLIVADGEGDCKACSRNGLKGCAPSHPHCRGHDGARASKGNLHQLADRWRSMVC